MSKILANQIASYTDNSPIELKEGLNIPAGKPLQAAGQAGSLGQILSSTGTTVQWITPFSGSYTDLTNKPTIPSAQVKSDWNAVGTIAEILNKPIIPPLSSVVTTSPSGGGSLSYNSVNGQFTFAPADGIADIVSDTTPQLGGNLDLNGFGITGIGSISCTGLVTGANTLLLGSSSSEFIIQFSQSTGTSPQIRNSIGNSGIGIYGAYNFGGTHEQDVHLGTSGQPSWFKNVEPRTDSTYNLGTSSKKWSNIHSANLTTEALKFSTNNPTILGTPGTTGEIKQIAGAPFWYDGSEWREFFLINSTAVTQTADTDWDNTIFRATFDNDFTDVRFGVTPSYNNGASITAAAVKVGTSSLRLQNQYLQYLHRAEYDFTGEWTIEGWFYWDTLPAGTGQSSDCIFSKYNSSFTGSNFMIGAENAVNGYVNFYWKNNASSTHNGSSGTLIAQYTNGEIWQKWNHIAVVREPLDGSIHFYLNGVEQVLTSSNQVIDNDIANSADHDLALGYYQAGSDSRNFDGYVDDFRISTVARYTSNFTAPTEPLPVTGSTTTVILPPTNKSGVLTLGVTPTWRGTSGVTVTQQSSGNYRLTFSSSYSNADDYYVITSVMDTGLTNNVFVVTNRSTTHVDFIVKEGSNLIDVADVAIQIINHD